MKIILLCTIFFIALMLAIAESRRDGLRRRKMTPAEQNDEDAEGQAL